MSVGKVLTDDQRCSDNPYMTTHTITSKLGPLGRIEWWVTDFVGRMKIRLAWYAPATGQLVLLRPNPIDVPRTFDTVDDADKIVRRWYPEATRWQ